MPCEGEIALNEYCMFYLYIGNVAVTEHWVASKSHSLGWSM